MASSAHPSPLLPDDPSLLLHEHDPVALAGALAQAARRLIESAEWALAEPDLDPAMVLLLQEEWGHVQRWRDVLAGATRAPGVDDGLQALVDRAGQAFAALVAAADRFAGQRDEAPV